MLKRLLIILVVFLLSFSFVSATEFSNFVFVRNLKIGDTHPDVLVLQTFLNTVLNSPLAVSGPGSTDQETNYFGSLTRAGVIRFQNMYKKEILAPVGLQTGSGYFGPMTRTKANAILGEIMNQKPVSKEKEKKGEEYEFVDVETYKHMTIPELLATAQEPEKFGVIKITSITPNIITYGTEVVIKGSNFERGNFILTALGLYKAVSTDGKEIRFRTVDGVISNPDIEPYVASGVMQVVNIKGASDFMPVNYEYK